MILAIMMILIPIAIVGYQMTLSQLDVLVAETRRAQDRLQARLLAQSALAVYRSIPPAERASTGPSLEGAIDGAGRYAIVVEPAESGEPTLRFRGVVEDFTTRLSAEILAAPAPPGAASPTPALRDLAYQIQHIDIP